MTAEQRSTRSAPDDSAECTRRLVLVPILHAPADMGSLAEGLASAIIERLGRRHWQEYLALVEGFWPAVRDALDALDLDYASVDLYQDGLPVCGREAELVSKAAEAGSENHQLLLDLAGLGASLMGTEDPGLLLEEYRDVKAALEDRSRGATGGAGPTAPRTPRVSRRDAYIARRIGRTLRAGRTGVLFLGMMHDVESHLPADIVVSRLVPLGPRQKGGPQPWPRRKQPR